MMVAALVLAASLGTTQAPARVLCLGDSAITKYSKPLAQSLGAKFVVQTAPMGKPSELKQILRSAPQFVLLSIGTSAASGDSAWRARRNTWVPFVEETIELLRAASSHPKVFLCLPPPVALPDSNVLKARLSEEVVPLLKQAARETDCPIIDFEAALRDRLDLVDGVQPSELAIDILADTVVDAIYKGRKADWRVVYADSEESDEGPAKNAIDGDPETYWHTNYSSTNDKYPHEIQVDTGMNREIGGFSYVPRQDGVNGRVAKYEFYVSLDGKIWGNPVAAGQFSRGSDLTKVFLAKPVPCRYFKFRALSEQQGQIWASVGELDILKFYPKRP